MITVTIHQKNGKYVGFLSEGHAFYSDSEYDVVCAGVSALTVNAVNSIEEFTKDKFAVRQDDGLIELILEGNTSKETTLLLDSMTLGLTEIQKQYGNEHIQVICKEV